MCNIALMSSSSDSQAIMQQSISCTLPVIMCMRMYNLRVTQFSTCEQKLKSGSYQVIGLTPRLLAT